MGHPLAALFGERIIVCVRDAASLDHLLAGFQVPPQIGIDRNGLTHGEHKHHREQHDGKHSSEGQNP